MEDNIIEKKYCLYYYQGKTFKVFFGKGIELNKKYNPDIVESVSDEEDSDNYTSFTQRTYSSVFDVRGVRIVKHLSFCRDSLFEVKIYSSTKKIDSLTTFVNKNMCIGEELKINKNDDFYSFSLLINNGNIIN
ncbi:hypothetical protein [Winogradskyella sp.]|uniref:hypothetical protein n=1 Tax=Winogradskyella sp. TaxID=1883156 RepID=UPI003BA906E6